MTVQEVHRHGKKLGVCTEIAEIWYTFDLKDKNQVP